MIDVKWVLIFISLLCIIIDIIIFGEFIMYVLVSLFGSSGGDNKNKTTAGRAIRRVLGAGSTEGYRLVGELDVVSGD